MRSELSFSNKDSTSFSSFCSGGKLGEATKSSSGSGKPPASLHDYGLIKSFLAVEVVTDPRHIGPGAFADFAQVRSVKSSLGEQLAGDLKDAVARGQWAPCRAGRPICFFTLPDSHTKPGLAVAVPTAFTMQKVPWYNYLQLGGDSWDEVRNLERPKNNRSVREGPGNSANLMAATQLPFRGE